jgi:hypothetical protein
MSIRRVNFLMSKPQVCFLLVLSLAVLSSSGCSNNKVAEASRRKALEIITASRDKTTPTADNPPPPAAPENLNAPTPTPAEDGTGEAEDNETDSARPIKEKRLYIDGSKSMAGFAGQGGDFDKFFSEIGYVLDDPTVYKFGSLTKNPAPKYADLIKPTTLGQAQKSPQFYDLYNNPDDALFAELNERGTEALSVYISDGVYSASDAKAGSKVITPLAKWFAGGRVLGIFVLTAPFNGNFYSEKLCTESKGQQCWLQNVKVRERPFYAFVFSPNEETFRRLQRKLKNKFTAMKSLVFADGALTSEALSLPEDESLYDSGEQSEGYYWQMFTPQLFSTQGPANLAFDIAYVVNQEYPLGSISPRVSAKYYLWDNQKSDFVDSELPPSFKITLSENDSKQTATEPPVAPPDKSSRHVAPPGRQDARLVRVSAQASISDKTPAKPRPARAPDGKPPTAKPKPDNEETQKAEAPSPSAAAGAETPAAQSAGFQLRIPRDARGLYGFYYLQIGVEVDALSTDVEKLSTDDDSNPAHAKFTYRFAEVIRALLEAHLRARSAARLTLPLFLTISN